jgi:hypothetical protein
MLLNYSLDHLTFAYTGSEVATKPGYGQQEEQTVRLNPEILPEWSTSHPRWTIALTVAVSVLFAMWLPRMRTDTDPKNMLPATSDVRVLNDQVDEWFGLHKDVIVVGVVREGGIFERTVLQTVERITSAISELDGVVSVDVTSLTTADNVVVDEGRFASSRSCRGSPRRRSRWSGSARR